MKYRIKLIICVALLIIPISVCIAINREEISYNYYVEIISDNSTPYTLYVPLPVYSQMFSDKENPSRITSKIKVLTGDIDFEIIETTYGSALKIEGVGSSSLQALGKNFYILDTPYRGSLISMRNSETEKRGDYWFYYSSSSEEPLSVQFAYDYKNDEVGSFNESEYRFAGDLTRGWNTVSVYESYLHGDCFIGWPAICCGPVAVVATIAALAYLFYLGAQRTESTDEKNE